MKETIMKPRRKSETAGCYLIAEGTIIRLGDLIPLTVENFKVFWSDKEKTLYELSISDFCKIEKGIYTIKDSLGKVNTFNYKIYKNIPKEVIEFLEANIK